MIFTLAILVGCESSSDKLVEVAGTFGDPLTQVSSQGAERFFFIEGDDKKRYWIKYAGDEVRAILECLKTGDRISGIIGQRTKTKTSKAMLGTGRKFELHESITPSDYTLKVVNITISASVIFPRLDELPPKRREVVLQKLLSDNPSATRQIVLRYKNK
jgi:hypothetical protein